MSDNLQLYLASRSPQRKQLLQMLNMAFGLLDIEIDEQSLPLEKPQDYVLRLAKEKAIAGWNSSGRIFPCPVLGSDTTVTIDDIILTKPKNHQEAFTMLNRLSGRTHQVLTAVAVVKDKQYQSSLSITDVTFEQLSSQFIENYIKDEAVCTYAGGYAIQGFAQSFIRHISGSYSGVVGLPLFETKQLLDNFILPRH